MKQSKEFNSIKMKSIPILKKHGVIKAGIFGFFARGDFNKKSDVDFLVKFRPGKGYFDLIRMEEELKKRIGRKIDPVTYKSLNHLLEKKVLEEEVRIL